MPSASTRARLCKGKQEWANEVGKSSPNLRQSWVLTAISFRRAFATPTANLPVDNHVNLIPISVSLLCLYPSGSEMLRKRMWLGDQRN